MATFVRTSSVRSNSDRTYTLLKYTDLRIGSNVIQENLFLGIHPLKRMLSISHGRQILQQVQLTQVKNPVQIKVLLENSSIFVTSGSGDIKFRFRTVPTECAEIVRMLQDVANVEIVNRANNMSASLVSSDFSQSQMFSQSTQDCFSQVPMFSNAQELQVRSSSLSNIASASHLSTMSDGLSSSSLNSFSNGSQNSVTAAFSQSPFMPTLTIFSQNDNNRFGSQQLANGSLSGSVSSQLFSNSCRSTELASSRVPVSHASILEQKPPLQGKESEIDLSSLSDDALLAMVQDQLKNPEFRHLVGRLEKINGNAPEKNSQSGADSTPATSQMFGTVNFMEEKPAMPYTPRFTVPEKSSRNQLSHSQPGDSLLSRLESLQKY